MVWMIAAMALAGQPGSGGSVVSVDSVAGRESGLTHGGLLGGKARIDAPSGVWVDVRCYGVRGLDKGVVDAIIGLSRPGTTVDDLPPTGRLAARASVRVGWQLGHTTREAGPRADVGLRLGWAERVGLRQWFWDLGRLSITGGDHTVRVGPVARVGWAFPIGEEVGDPLLTAHLGGWVGAPIVAWGNHLGWEEGEPESSLAALGVRSLAGLEPIRGRIELDLGLQVRRLQLSVSPSVRWWADGAATRRAGGSSPEAEHLWPGVRLSLGLVI